MATITVTPAPGVSFSVQGLVNLFNSGLVEGDISGASSSEIIISGTLNSQSFVLKLAGSFVVFGGIPISGSINNVDFSLGGVPQVSFSISPGVTLSEVFAVQQQENVDPSAIETYIMSHNWNVDLTAVSGTIVAVGTQTVGDDVPFNLRGNDVFDFGGDAHFFAGDGNDILRGGNGIDTLIGGLGDDTLDGGGVPNPDSQGNFLLGGDGNDSYIVRSVFDLVDEDVVFAGHGHGGVDTIHSKAAWYWDVHSIAEKLVIDSDAATIGGGIFSGVSSIIGGIFNNELVGNAGNNMLFGRGGSDIYRGGDGIDQLALDPLGVNDENAYAGVNGPNTVVVDPRQTGDFSMDVVWGFEVGKDKIDISAFNYDSAAEALQFAFFDDNGNFWVPLGDGLDYVALVEAGPEYPIGGVSANDFII